MKVVVKEMSTDTLSAGSPFTKKQDLLSDLKNLKKYTSDLVETYTGVTCVKLTR